MILLKHENEVLHVTLASEDDTVEENLQRNVPHLKFSLEFSVKSVKSKCKKCEK